MPIQRKEPVIDSHACDLTDRVKLTWRDVRDMAAAAQTPRPAAPAFQAAPVMPVVRKPAASASPAASAAPAVPAAPPVPAGLSPEEKAALTAVLAPAIEQAVRNALRETLEVSLQNAVTRARADIDRSVSGIVAESVSRELSRIDLSTLIRR